MAAGVFQYPRSSTAILHSDGQAFGRSGSEQARAHGQLLRQSLVNIITSQYDHSPLLHRDNAIDIIRRPLTRDQDHDADHQDQDQDCYRMSHITLLMRVTILRTSAKW